MVSFCKPKKKMKEDLPVTTAAGSLPSSSGLRDASQKSWNQFYRAGELARQRLSARGDQSVARKGKEVSTRSPPPPPQKKEWHFRKLSVAGEKRSVLYCETE